MLPPLQQHLHRLRSVMMKILIFHPALLPPRHYGGTERVVLWLAKGLKELGHSVWVACFEDSRLPKGIEHFPVSRQDCSPSLLTRQKLPSGLEVIHFMAPPDSQTLSQLPCASLLTVHGNGKRGEQFMRNSVFLSQDHAKRHQASVYVHNGIDPEEYLFEPVRKKDWFLFLSKTSWKVKNVWGASRLCRNARVPLKIAGGNRPWSLRLALHFSQLQEWLGSVSGETKARLLCEAKALLFPIRWSEPFGLVVAEALMSGTPVIASRTGSLPELLPDPKLGMLLPMEGIDSKEENPWVEALKGHFQTEWNPEACRQWAMDRFHYIRMTKNYLTLYQKIQQGQFLHPEMPMVAANTVA